MEDSERPRWDALATVAVSLPRIAVCVHDCEVSHVERCVGAVPGLDLAAFHAATLDASRAVVNKSAFGRGELRGVAWEFAACRWDDGRYGACFPESVVGEARLKALVRSPSFVLLVHVDSDSGGGDGGGSDLAQLDLGMNPFLLFP